MPSLEVERVSGWQKELKGNACFFNCSFGGHVFDNQVAC